ncbi:cysteine hydrolase family protein [Calderihabitans maritimus]|uniref:cysteine hydrolase family protein n=1 Tax=Calderihabitans maritimus TaxID=1246530 RepID=UPI000B50B0CA|nr:isochorismatase family cysteine hydrolase [Calderihabitans maritimus]
MSKKALLIIDMLNDFVREDGALYVGPDGKRIVPKIQEEIEKARKSGIPVIYICDNHREDDAEFNMFPPHCIKGTEGSEVIKELEPAPGDYIIPKRRYSAFFGTDLDALLRELGVEELILTGVCSNICVLYTAADARMRNYRVTVVKDGVASFKEEVHRFALQEMESTLGVVIK